jgi:hypothetical protein
MCVEELSDAIAVVARSCNSGMLGLNPTWGMDIRVCPPYRTQLEASQWLCASFRKFYPYSKNSKFQQVFDFNRLETLCHEG